MITPEASAAYNAARGAALGEDDDWADPPPCGFCADPLLDAEVCHCIPAEDPNDYDRDRRDDR